MTLLIAIVSLLGTVAIFYICKMFYKNIKRMADTYADYIFSHYRYFTTDRCIL